VKKVTRLPAPSATDSLSGNNIFQLETAILVWTVRENHLAACRLKNRDGVLVNIRVIEASVDFADDLACAEHEPLGP
jgi:hypothetical protein